MKLLDNYNRMSIVLTAGIIIITGVVYYYAISYILTRKVDEDLRVEENEIFNYVRINDALPTVYKSEDLKIIFAPVGYRPVERYFFNTSFIKERNNEQESARALITTVRVKGLRYRVTIIESTVETEDLIRIIFLITVFILLTLIILLFLMNRLLIRNLWQPFYRMLRQIKLFNLADQNTITELETKIDEFKEMNAEITAMSLRVKKDYMKLKGFVENASHELMTPIAVINSKIDSLVQLGLNTDEQGDIINDVYRTLRRLKKLNRSMLMLARIENRLIQQKTKLDLKQILQDLINDFQALFDSKRIKVTAALNKAEIEINKDLLYILLNNLLTNAIHHNLPDGIINIKLSEHYLEISNTGQGKMLDTENVFTRFFKSAESEGTGLGLALVKEICEIYNFELSYRYEDEMHVFSVRF